MIQEIICFLPSEEMYALYGHWIANRTISCEMGTMQIRLRIDSDTTYLLTRFVKEGNALKIPCGAKRKK